MVSPNTLDSKEEGPDIPKRKGIENKPEDTSSLTSKMSDHSSGKDIPPETVVIWMMVSVAVGLLTIYTMVQWISGKLNEGIESGKKAGRQSKNQHRKPTHISNQETGSQDLTNYDINLQTPEEKREHDVDEEGQIDESITDDLQMNLVTSEDGLENAENNDDLNILDALKNIDEAQGNLDFVDEMSIQMGPGFCGSLSIGTDASTQNQKLACIETCKSASNDENLNETAQNAINYRSAATLQNHDNLKYTAPVTVNYFETKSLSCNANNPQLVSAKPKDMFSGSPGIHPSCTFHCVQTALKSVRVEDDLDAHKTAHTENNDLPASTTESEDFSTNTAASKCVSDSLNFLASYHTPQETTDGSILSENTSQDELMFPQGNGMATDNQPINSSKEAVDLETPRSRFLKRIQEDPEFSKSLDSQMEVLKKGCKLLKTKPLKSSLRRTGSEENMKKFVHFPADIRHIRTVYKYHSFDEAWYDALDVDGSTNTSTKPETQSI